MSEFDKEAEREKLRKKYERDVEKRQATQRMSDLLLKGATMTNSHCGTCGDPLFQQDGTTFCPGCHGTPDAVEGTDLEAQPADDAEATSTPTDRQPADADRQQPADRPATPAPEQSAATDRSEPTADRPTTSEPDRTATPASDRSEPTADRRGASQRSRDESDPVSPEPTPERATDSDLTPQARSATAKNADTTNASRDTTNASLDTAHASLVAALETFAAKAAETDDPRHAKACLEAAREASETIATLR